MNGVVWYRYPSSVLLQVYDWVLHWAGTKYAVPALFAVAFVESSFFPIPPDILLMAMALYYPSRAFFYALVCSAGSVIGGMFGYVIGYFLWGLVHSFFIPHIFSQEVFNMVQGKFELYSFWVIFIAAFTPIPYKVFTISAGVCHIPLAGFILASLLGRSLRFFLVAGFLYFFGEKTKNFISKYFEWLTILFAALLLGGFWMAKKIF